MCKLYAYVVTIHNITDTLAQTDVLSEIIVQVCDCLQTLAASYVFTQCFNIKYL